MRIAIIGAGNVGKALAAGWLRAGHEIVFGVRQPSRMDLAAPADSPEGAAAAAQVVVLALPWAAAEAAVAQIGPLDGKTVIDCMNPLAIGPAGLGLDRGYTTSGGEEVQRRLPAAHVVKTLNQTGAEVMADATRFAQRPVQFLAGEDAGAKDVAAALVADLGFEPLDAGGIAQARLLEPLAMVWINQALIRGLGRAWAFGALRRQDS